MYVVCVIYCVYLARGRPLVCALSVCAHRFMIAFFFVIFFCCCYVRFVLLSIFLMDRH